MRALFVVCLPLALAGCSLGKAELQFEAEQSGWGGTAGQPDPEQVEQGKQIALRECSSCHAVDKTSVSPNLNAPPLREVLAVNDPDFLAYRFIDAMRVGHDAMPLFDFDVRAADALMAYIASIS